MAKGTPKKTNKTEAAFKKQLAEEKTENENKGAGTSSAANGDQKKAAPDPKDLLPVTLLCGFLGAGKTTLLKHVLETKHAEDNFKCAVIVNDMAALNIDKSLIDQSALVQSDEVIAMQNGCFCCTLQNDLVEQIITLAQKKMFNYMLIEASGVSEPAQIAPLFELCDDEHDHEEEHKEGPELGEVARLDTCVTVVDAAEFHNNLESMTVYEEGETQGTIAELLTEQVEFSNVVVLNKQDLVSKEQQQEVLERIALLNPKAKILKSLQSKIDVMEILNTGRFKNEEIYDDSVMIAATRIAAAGKFEKVDALPDCCIESEESGKKKCCKKKEAQNGQMVDTGMSQVMLGVVSDSTGRQQKTTRHESRFGITSFVYKARRPFHPGRLYDQFMETYFVLRYEEKDGPELGSDLTKLQEEAKEKQKKRSALMGELMRSKGFVWVATSNFIMGGWQSAGNILRIEGEGPWMCETRDLWEGTVQEELVRSDLRQANGEEYPHGDRRQELVFIGVGLKHAAIQKLLDSCLLTDDEMAMGPEKWEEELVEVDKINLTLGDDDEEGEEEEEEEGDEDEEGEDDDEEDGEDEKESAADGKKTNGTTEEGATKRKAAKATEEESPAPSPSKKSKKGKATAK